MKQTVNILLMSVALAKATPLTQLAQASFAGESGALVGENVNQDLLDIAEAIGVGSWGTDTVHSTLAHIDADIGAAMTTLSSIEPNTIAAVGSAKDDIIAHVDSVQAAIKGTSDFGNPSIGLSMT